MTAIDDVAGERKRQMEKEGWSHKHDDQHTDQSLAMAAALYASPRDDLVVVEKHDGGVEYADPWPWHDTVDVSGGRGDCPVWGQQPAWDKRKKHDRQRRLVIAAALLVAEIERLDRQSFAKAEN